MFVGNYWSQSGSGGGIEAVEEIILLPLLSEKPVRFEVKPETPIELQLERPLLQLIVED